MLSTPNLLFIKKKTRIIWGFPVEIGTCSKDCHLCFDEIKTTIDRRQDEITLACGYEENKTILGLQFLFCYQGRGF